MTGREDPKETCISFTPIHVTQGLEVTTDVGIKEKLNG